MPSPQKPKLGLEDLKTVAAATDPASASSASTPSRHTQTPQAPQRMQNVVSSKQVAKRDGTREPWNADRINKSIERATYGIPNPLEKVMQIASETELTIYDGITTEEMDQATINAALQN